MNDFERNATAAEKTLWSAIENNRWDGAPGRLLINEAIRWFHEIAARQPAVPPEPEPRMISIHHWGMFHDAA